MGDKGQEYVTPAWGYCAYRLYLRGEAIIFIGHENEMK